MIGTFQEVLSALIFVVALTPWLYFCIVVHELGHWLTARWLGMFTSHVEIGKGPLMFHVVIWHDNWRFYWQWFPTSGFVVLFSSSKWWKNLCMSAGGPIADLILAAIAYRLIPDVWFALIPLVSGITNLAPFKTPKFKSDGPKIMEAWRRRNEVLSRSSVRSNIRPSRQRL